VLDKKALYLRVGRIKNTSRVSSFSKLWTIKEKTETLGSHQGRNKTFFRFCCSVSILVGVIMGNEETDKCLCRGSGETLSAGID